MANAKRCDRCGSYYQNYSGIYYNKFYFNTGCLFDPCNGKNAKFDLCPECMKKLFDFFGIDNEEAKNNEIEKRIIEISGNAAQSRI